MAPPVFKIAFLGDAGVGKTTFINRHYTGDFQKSYKPTLTQTQYIIPFDMTDGHANIHINVQCIDVSGQQHHPSQNETLPIEADAYVLMFDVTSILSYKNVPQWYDLILELQKGRMTEAPVVICGNKVDMGDQSRRVSPRNINFHRHHGLEYYDISAKSNYNHEKPFLYLLRQWTGNDNLTFGLI